MRKEQIDQSAFSFFKIIESHNTRRYDAVQSFLSYLCNSKEKFSLLRLFVSARYLESLGPLDKVLIKHFSSPDHSVTQNMREKVVNIVENEALKAEYHTAYLRYLVCNVREELRQYPYSRDETIKNNLNVFSLNNLANVVNLYFKYLINRADNFEDNLNNIFSLMEAGFYPEIGFFFLRNKINNVHGVVLFSYKSTLDILWRASRNDLARLEPLTACLIAVVREADDHHIAELLTQFNEINKDQFVDNKDRLINFLEDNLVQISDEEKKSESKARVCSQNKRALIDDPERQGAVRPQVLETVAKTTEDQTITLESIQQRFVKNFIAQHKKMLDDDKMKYCGIFFWLRSTNLTYKELTVQEIFQHAEAKNNRTRRVLKEMGYLNEVDGRKTEKYNALQGALS